MKKKLSQKTFAWIVIGLVVAAVAAVCVLVGIPMVRFVSEPEQFRVWVDGHGIWGRVVFTAMVFFQVVVALIPGEPFEIVAGYAFGAVEGTILCMLGATLGSICVFLLVRKYGKRVVGLFFKEEQLEKLTFLKSSAKRELLFMIIFIIPGTPKDLLCYFAGMTDMPFTAWLLICSLGRFPSLITSTIGGDALGTQSYLSAAVVFGVTLLISGLGILVYNKFCQKKTEELSPEETKQEENEKN